MTVRIVGVTDVGLIREHNEDNFLVVALDSGETDFGLGREVSIGPRGSLLVVCDGMGGAAAGEVASKMAVDVILREMSPESKPDGATTKPEGAAARHRDSRSDGEPDTIPQQRFDMGADPSGIEKLEKSEKSEKLDEKPEHKPDPETPTPSSPIEAITKPDGVRAPPLQSTPNSTESAATAEVVVPRLSPRTIDDLLAGLDDHLTPAAATPPAPSKSESLVKPDAPAEPAKSDAEPAAKEPTPAEAEGAAPKSAVPVASEGSGPTSASGPINASSRSDSAQREAEMHVLARKLRIAATKANQEIYDAACADIAKAGMGTTLTGLLLVRTHVIVAQVGDSRAYMWRKGKLTQITHDQSLVNQLLDSGQITPEQAKLFEHSNVILQALGVQEDVEVVLSTEEVRRDDRLLLCSDGLVGVVADEEIQEVLTTSEKIEEAARRLVDLARAGGGPDNITVIVAQVMGDGAPLPAATEEVAYRPLYLDGEKPPERRVWAPEYGFIGQPMLGHSMASGSSQPPPVSSRVSVMAMSAVLALLVAGIVAGVVWYKQPQERPTTNSTIPQPLPTPPSSPTAPPNVNPQVPTPPQPGDLMGPKPAGTEPQLPVTPPVGPTPPIGPTATPPVAPIPPTETPGVPTPPPTEPTPTEPPDEVQPTPPEKSGETPAKPRRHRTKKPPVQPGQPTPPTETPVATPPITPTTPTEKPPETPPTEKPATPVEKPATPVEKPAAPTEKAAPSLEKPAAPAEKTAPAPAPAPPPAAKTAPAPAIEAPKP